MWSAWSRPSLTLPLPRVPSLLLAFLPNCRVCVYFLTCGERILTEAELHSYGLYFATILGTVCCK